MVGRKRISPSFFVAVVGRSRIQFIMNLVSGLEPVKECLPLVNHMSSESLLMEAERKSVELWKAKAPLLSSKKQLIMPEICQGEKYDFISPPPIFFPQYIVCEKGTITAWPKGEKYRHMPRRLSDVLGGWRVYKIRYFIRCFQMSKSIPVFCVL
jgi:hypothetical protein